MHGVAAVAAARAPVKPVLVIVLAVVVALVVPTPRMSGLRRSWATPRRSLLMAVVLAELRLALIRRLELPDRLVVLPRLVSGYRALGVAVAAAARRQLVLLEQQLLVCSRVVVPPAGPVTLAAAALVSPPRCWEHRAAVLVLVPLQARAMVALVAAVSTRQPYF